MAQTLRGAAAPASRPAHPADAHPADGALSHSEITLDQDLREETRPVGTADLRPAPQRRNRADALLAKEGKYGCNEPPWRSENGGHGPERNDRRRDVCESGMGWERHV